jgi:hypothetical protein
VDTQRRQWTELGYRRAETEVVAKKRKFQALTASLEDQHGLTLSRSEGKMADAHAAVHELNVALDRWHVADEELSRLRIAPMPRQCTTVQTGHKIRMLYIDSDGDQKKGTEETFIQGGIGERWEEEGIVRVRACNFPVGRAIVGARVNEIRTVESRGKSYDVKILEISIPDLNALRAECEAAQLEQLKAA